MSVYVDLKAFERRLTDVISQLHPVAWRWRGTVFCSFLYYNFRTCTCITNCVIHCARLVRG